MKKLCLLLTFFFTSLQAEIVQGAIVGGENLAYLVLNDGSFWKVFSFVKRWRGPLEWFRGDDLGVPENYLSPVSQWVAGSEVDVCSKAQVFIDFANASNQEDLKLASHLFVNRHTGRTVFAIPMTADHLLAAVFNQGKQIGKTEAYEEGYQNGFSSGKMQGYSEGFLKGQNLQNRSPANPPPYGAN